MKQLITFFMTSLLLTTFAFAMGERDDYEQICEATRESNTRDLGVKISTDVETTKPKSTNIAQ